MMPPGLFDPENRFEKLDKTGDPLVKLNKVVQWESFRKALENVELGRKPTRAPMYMPIPPIGPRSL